MAFLRTASASPVLYNFDAFADGTVVDTQIPGLTFFNTAVLKSGLSLNEFEFPPHSGDGVVSDNGGPLTIDFFNPVSSVGGYFNYASGLTLSAYDSLNQLLGLQTAAFNSNLALSGDAGSSSNDLLSISDPGGRIAKLVVTGDPLGGSFTLDDLTVDSSAAVLPEPSTLALVLLGVAGIAFIPKMSSRHRRKS